MKRYLKYMLLAPAALFLTVSCYEDKGNYDYSDVGEAHIRIPPIDDNDGAYSCDWLKTVSLDPQVELADGTTVNDNDYDYEWNFYPATVVQNQDGSYQPKKKMGESRVLSYTLEVEDVPGNYYVVLTATNKLTQAVTFYRFNMTVQAINGWMVLDKDAQGDMDIHMVRDQYIIPTLRDDQEGVEYNLYATANGGDKMRDVKFLSQVNNNWGTYYNIYAFAKEGFYKINPRNFELKSDNFTAMFTVQPTNYNPQAHYAYHPYASRLDLMINDGVLYYIRWNMMGQTDRYGTPVTGPFSAIYKFAPFMAPIPWGGAIVNVLYNDTYYANRKSFVSVGQHGTVTFVSTTENKEFDSGNIDAVYDEVQQAWVRKYDFKPIFIGTGTSGVTCGVFRDQYDNDARWLLTVDFRNSETPMALIRKNISAVTGVMDATHFLFGIRGDVMFYATPDGVYSYVYSDTAAQPKLILPLTGETVSSLKLYQHYQNETHTGKILMVGANSGSTGKVYMVHFNELSGELSAEGIMTFDGFNEIVDMYIKE